MADGDTVGGSSGGGGSSLFSSPLSLGSVGTAAAGGAGLAGLFSMGETAPPWEFGQVASNAATLEGESGTLFGEGQTFTNQGAQALQMAQNGQLTQPQQAALQLYRAGIEQYGGADLCEHGPQYQSGYVGHQHAGQY